MPQYPPIWPCHITRGDTYRPVRNRPVGLHGRPRATRFRIVRSHARFGARLHRRWCHAVHCAPSETNPRSAMQVPHRRRTHVHRIRGVNLAVDRPGHNERAIRGSQPCQLLVADAAGADDRSGIAQTWCGRQSDSWRGDRNHRCGDGGWRRKP